jgi:hypothetical protein
MDGCPACGNEDDNVHLGDLGGRHHFRCRDCGTEFSVEVGEDYCRVCELYECECEDENAECAFCGEAIEEGEEYESTPQGTMHTECAVHHEEENPEEW